MTINGSTVYSYGGRGQWGAVLVNLDEGPLMSNVACNILQQSNAASGSSCDLDCNNGDCLKKSFVFFSPFCQYTTVHRLQTFGKQLCLRP